MALMVADTGGGDFKPVAEGTHIGVCFLVADIGFQETTYGAKRKIIVGWELPQELIEVNGEEKPQIIYNTYTASLSEKANLRQDLESWRGRTFTPEELAGFDLFNVLGVACMLSVVHNTTAKGTYANIRAVSALPKGMDRPKASRLLKYSQEDSGQFDDLPEWIQKKIQGALTAVQENRGSMPSADFDDSIPF